jgi:hypothetical protein
MGILINGVRIKLLRVTETIGGLSFVFIFVSLDEFHCITLCEASKDVWDIPEKIHEGSRGVRKSKLQILTSRLRSLQ